ncbi:MAG: 2-oxo acid dehydrogenase subunit E2 [Anaerolineales bacterium]
MNTTTENQSFDRRTKPRYKVIPFSFERQVVASTLAVGSQQKNIHALIEVDITEPRRLMREHKQRTGESLSLTAYVVTCLGHAVAAHPHLNAFRKGRKLILLENVSIGTLVEREINGELVPENVGIRGVQAKSYRQVHDEIRAIQRQPSASMGELSGSGWVRFIPRFLFKTFVRLASRSLTMNDAQAGDCGWTTGGPRTPAHYCHLQPRDRGRRAGCPLPQTLHTAGGIRIAAAGSSVCGRVAGDERPSPLPNPHPGPAPG